MLKRIISNERGWTLAWALVVMGIGTLLIPPLLVRVSTSLIASRAIEESLKEQYAADSGVEYALLQLKNGITTGQHSHTLNKKAVAVTWGQYITDTYKITSTATSHTAGGNSTTIESYVSLEVTEPSQLLAGSLAGPTGVTLQSASAVSDTVASSGATVRVHIRTYHIYP